MPWLISGKAAVDTRAALLQGSGLPQSDTEVAALFPGLPWNQVLGLYPTSSPPVTQAILPRCSEEELESWRHGVVAWGHIAGAGAQAQGFHHCWFLESAEVVDADANHGRLS
jgi:hypothetical protein